MKRLLQTMFTVILFSLAAAPGCDSGDLRSGPDVFDPGPVDTGTDVQSIPDEAPEPGYYNPDVPHDTVLLQPIVPSPSFRFEMAGQEDGALLVNVVARDLGTVFGVALRVDYAPEDFEYLESTIHPLFGADGSEAVYMDGSPRPGEIAIGMAHKGFQFETELPADAVLATIKLLPRTGKEAELSFFGERCLAVTRKLDKVEAAYVSAILYP